MYKIYSDIGKADTFPPRILGGAEMFGKYCLCLPPPPAEHGTALEARPEANFVNA